MPFQFWQNETASELESGVRRFIIIREGILTDLCIHYKGRNEINYTQMHARLHWTRIDEIAIVKMYFRETEKTTKIQFD